MKALLLSLLLLACGMAQAQAQHADELRHWPADTPVPRIDAELRASLPLCAGQLPLLKERPTRLYRLAPIAPAPLQPQFYSEDPIVESLLVFYDAGQGCLVHARVGRAQMPAPGALSSPFPNMALPAAAAAQPVYVLEQDRKAVRPWYVIAERDLMQWRSTLVWGLLAVYLGVLVTLPILSLELGLLGQPRLAAAYCFYVCTLTLWMLQNFGIGAAWLPAWPGPEHFIVMHGLVVALLVLGIGVATLEALRLRGPARLRLIVAVCAVAAMFALSFADSRLYRIAALGLNLLALAVILLLGQRWRDSSGAQRLLGVGIGATMIGGALQSLTIVMPDSPLRPWGLYAFPIGNLIHAVFWVAAINRQLTAQREMQRAQLHHEARHDSVTGLANRRQLEEAVMGLGEPMLREGGCGAIFIDLDHFKVLNNSLGHSVGDELLRRMAALLQRMFPPPALVARFGGDEFFVLLPGEGDEGRLALLGQGLLREISEPVALAGRTLRLSASIGLVVLDEHHRGPDELVKDADLALHAAKARGRARFEMFELPMRAQAEARFHLESALRIAIERGEFEPFFQPIVNLDDGTHAGFEALVRWRQPERGLVSPAEFIPVAEQTGLIQQIGLLMMQGTVQQVAAWRASGLWREGWYVSVNVSGVQLRDARLVDRFAALIAEAGVEREDIRIELTESSLIEHKDVAFGLLPDFRAEGLLLCMDDFGTGYSSLSYISELPFDVLKIDRSFVTDIDKRPELKALARTILTLSREMGMKVVAEGIETAAERGVLEGLDCGYGQGYLFAKPLPANEAGEWLRKALPLAA